MVDDVMVTDLATESHEEAFLHWVYLQSSQHDDIQSN